MTVKFKTFRKLLVIALLLAYPTALPAVTPPIPDHPAQYVVDLAGVLDAEARARLNARLKDLEAETTVQMVVLTINSLEGEPIEGFSHQTAVKWGIGQKGQDNGVLLTVAVKDHKYRIEVGYGLESTLPDSLVGSIGREYLAPNFRKGDYAGGLEAATTEIISKLTAIPEAAASDAEPTAAAPVTETPSEGKTPSRLILLAIIIFVIVLLPAIALIVPRLIWARTRGGRSFWSTGSGGSGGDSSWGSSGSSDFSGGGGDFGGGGASGDW